MKDNAHDILKLAMHLRMYGENAPGGRETWKEFDTRCEAFLRETEELTEQVTGIPQQIVTIPPVIPVGEISDGYHTFNDLYDHRRALTAAFFKLWPTFSWKSKNHHPDDEPMFEGGYFIVGLDLPTGQISYHYKLHHWDDFSSVIEIPHAPKWDGHTPEMTVARLLKWAKR